ncbi:MAG: peptide ABC transporter substrate-binding protein [Chloroflexota bacterium]|nr:peptide ABC transporter substrate-binding protein [Chloroflexota bacterium]
MWFKKSMGALVALGLVLAACTSPSSSTEPSGSTQPSASQAPPAEQVLRVDIGNEPPSLDPTQATDSASIQVLRSTTFPLAYFDEELSVTPGIADDWDVSADGTEITFHLGDYKYSNGEDIVADDFVYSWQRLSDPREAAGYSYVMADVVGFNEISAIDTATATDAEIDAALQTLGVSAPDPKTFVVKLTHAASYFVYIATLWVTVPQKAGMTWGEADGYVSSGPMVMTEWNHNSNIVLEPNTNWNGDEVKIARIEFSMIDDPAASLAAYEADELDIGGVPTQEIPRIQDDPELSAQVLEGAVLSIYYFGFDMKDPNGPFAKSKLLRRAFSEAIDKETMIATTFSGIGLVANSLVPPGMPGYQADEFIPYNVAQAQADFAAGLVEAGLTEADLNLQVGYNSGSNHEDKVDFLVEQWRTAFGVEVEAVGLEWGAYLTRLNEDPFDIFRLGWGADYPHPNNFLTDLISCASGNNNMAYCNPDVDALLLQAAVKKDLGEQVALYNQAQELMMADAPLIPLRFGQRFTLIKPWVQNLVPTSQDSSTGELFYYKVTIASH